MRFVNNMYAHFNTARMLVLGALVVALSACGGGGSSGSSNLGPGAGTGGGGSSTGGSTTETVVSFGSLQNGAFVLGQAEVSVSTLSAGGTAEVTVNLVDQDNNPIADTYTVNFTSGCVADGTASLETGVTTTGGQAASEYVANGCVGSDEIRATVDVDGDTLTAIATITVAQEAIGSIEFVNADPTQIALSGTGGDETSRVTFRVLGEAGGPIANATVDFALNSTTGGLALTSDSALSNSNGEVSTIVQSGTIATSVRVTATEQSTGISTQSSQLTVSTGIPDSDSFTLGLLPANPEGLHINNETVTVTVQVADAFNNPVPENTAISFFTEGGSIDSTCATNSTGACSVEWRSQDPRPANGDATILASVIGNESFTDQNGNGLYDDGEPFEDLGEAFADENENGVYDVGEFFIDFGPGGTPDGVRNGPDGLYNGVLCSETATTCSPDRTLIVSEQTLLVMSGSYAVETALLNGTTGDPILQSDPATTSGTLLRILAQDENGNSMPGGTSVSASVSTGLRLEGAGSSVTVSDLAREPLTGPLFSVEQSNANNPVPGTLTITFTAPSGLETIYSYAIVP